MPRNESVHARVLKEDHTMATQTDRSEQQRKADGLFELANIAEREGRLDAAIELSNWACETAPYVPYTDAEMATLRTPRSRRIAKGTR
mgnify:CR=1 FL=1